MRQNTKKFKPNPTRTSRYSIRSSSIRDIIGDRRFNHVNPHGTEGIKKVKRIKADDPEAEPHDLPNLGGNSSSIQYEWRIRDKLKQTTSSDIHVNLKHHDIQVNSVQKTDHSTREGIPNIHKQSIKYAKSSSPIEKEQYDPHYSFLSPPICGSNNPEVNNDYTNVVKVTPREFTDYLRQVAATQRPQREKLNRMVSDMSLYDVKELSSKGIDLISALMNRILPKNQNNNFKDKPDSKHKAQESNKAKIMESCHLDIDNHDDDDDDDDFPRSLKRHLELKESCFVHDDYDSEVYKRKCFESNNLSYLENNDLPRSLNRFTVRDMDLLEWNPDNSKSLKSNHHHSDAYKTKWMEFNHISYLEDVIPKSSEWNSNNDFYSEDKFRLPNISIDFDDESKDLQQPQPLLLGWEKDEFETFLTSQDDDHDVTSSIVLYSWKDAVSVEDCRSIEDDKWCLNDKEDCIMFLDENENENEKSFVDDDDKGFCILNFKATMRQNTKRFKPNPTKTSRYSIRSSSVRDIIGDRRFNHVNPHGTEGIKEVKRMKADEAEALDLPNLGRNSSSVEYEAVEDPTRYCGDSSAKTSEYAFFKKLKQTTSSNIHVNLKHHDIQVNSVQQSDHSTREVISNIQKQSIKYAKSSSPTEKEQDDPHYSFLSPPFHGSKNLELNNDDIKVTPREYNRLSPPGGSNTKTSGIKGVFALKREKLNRMVSDMSLYDVKELSSKGIDLISALMNRILPKNQNNNFKDKPDSKHKAQESNKAKVMESCHLDIDNHDDDDDDDFPRSLKRHLELKESCFVHDDYDSEAFKRKCLESNNLSYLDNNDLPISSKRFRVTDMDLLEWNPNHSESSKLSHHHSDAYKTKWMEFNRISYLEDVIPKSSEWNSNNDFYSEDRFRLPNISIDFDDESKELQQPQPLLLGWEKDEFETFLTSQDDDDHHHDVTSSIVPYSWKDDISVQDYRSIEDDKWCRNDKEDCIMFLDENENENENEKSFVDDDDKDFDEIGYKYNYYPLLLCDSSDNEL
ncbi:hypothetical protein LXL04_018700 [Taraxacum kok-saghyz]